MGVLQDHAPHSVLFYETDAELVENAHRYLAANLLAGSVAVILGTPEHTAALFDALNAGGIDVAEARNQGFIVTLDAGASVERFLVDGSPDPIAFEQVIGTLVRDIRNRGQAVAAYGEMVAVLWKAGNVTAALELEVLWNELLNSVDFSLFCAYPTAIVEHIDLDEDFANICQLHGEVSGATAILPASGSRRLPTELARDFTRSAEAPRAARRFVAGALRSIVDDGALADIAAVVTELATNATLHARTDFRVTISGVDGAILLRVQDRSVASPVMQEPALHSTSGRGMLIVDRLAQRWGVEQLPSGKTVWAEMAIAKTDDLADVRGVAV